MKLILKLKIKFNKKKGNQVMQLVIKGAIFRDGNVLLRPLSTGYFYNVDCVEYKTVEDMIDEFGEEQANKFIKDGVILNHNGEKYYQCEADSFDTTDMVLLTDFTNYFDDSVDF